MRELIGKGKQSPHWNAAMVAASLGCSGSLLHLYLSNKGNVSFHLFSSHWSRPVWILQTNLKAGLRGDDKPRHLPSTAKCLKFPWDFRSQYNSFDSEGRFLVLLPMWPAINRKYHLAHLSTNSVSGRASIRPAEERGILETTVK